MNKKQYEGLKEEIKYNGNRLYEIEDKGEHRNWILGFTLAILCLIFIALLFIALLYINSNINDLKPIEGKTCDVEGYVERIGGSKDSELMINGEVYLIDEWYPLIEKGDYVCLDYTNFLDDSYNYKILEYASEEDCEDCLETLEFLEVEG